MKIDFLFPHTSATGRVMTSLHFSFFFFLAISGTSTQGSPCQDHLTIVNITQTKPKSYHKQNKTEATNESGYLFADCNVRFVHFRNGIQSSI